MMYKDFWKELDRLGFFDFKAAKEWLGALKGPMNDYSPRDFLIWAATESESSDWVDAGIVLLGVARNSPWLA